MGISTSAKLIYGIKVDYWNNEDQEFNYGRGDISDFWGNYDQEYEPIGEYIIREGKSDLNVGIETVYFYDGEYTFFIAAFEFEGFEDGDKIPRDRLCINEEDAVVINENLKKFCEEKGFNYSEPCWHLIPERM